MWSQVDSLYKTQESFMDPISMLPGFVRFEVRTDCLFTPDRLDKVTGDTSE